jgi:hypothetical protein
VAVQFAAGKAEMRVDNLALGDYHNVANGLGPHWQTAFDPAVVSFDVVWSRPITRRVHVADGTLGNNYAGEYVENQVTVTWSGTNLKEGFTFTSNPGTFATSSVDGGFAELGHERNGTFFGEDSRSSAPQASSSNAGAGRDQAFVALRDHLNDPGNGAGQALPARDLMNVSAGHSAEDLATVVRAARDRAFDLLSDPEATSLATENGLQGADILFR